MILSFSFRGCQIVADVFDLLTVLLAGQSNKLYELQNLCEHFTLTTLHYHLPHMLFLKCPDVCVYMDDLQQYISTQSDIQHSAQSYAHSVPFTSISECHIPQIPQALSG